MSKAPPELRINCSDGVMGLRRHRYFRLFGPLLLVLMMPTKSTIPNYLSCFVSGPNFNGSKLCRLYRLMDARVISRNLAGTTNAEVPRSSLKLNADSTGPLAHQVQEPTFDWYVPSTSFVHLFILKLFLMWALNLEATNQSGISARRARISSNDLESVSAKGIHDVRFRMTLIGQTNAISSMKRARHLPPKRQAMLAADTSQPIPGAYLCLPAGEQCHKCAAFKFAFESKKFCCGDRDIMLPQNNYPEFLVRLYTSHEEDAVHFRKYVCLYNNLFTFSSIGGDFDSTTQKAASSKSVVKGGKMSTTIYCGYGDSTPYIHRWPPRYEEEVFECNGTRAAFWKT
ncbi:hypothetical protein KSS87_019046 [Heliosperma pusillum]|nr:hypothetical protein KSS87_019046 [Heliosperma pusillum]